MSRYKTPKRPPPEIGLFMECEDEELSPSQKQFYGKIKRDNQKFTKKMDEYIAKMKGELIVDEGDCFLFQIKHGLNAPAPPKPTPAVETLVPIAPTPVGQKTPRFTTVPPAPAVKTPQTRGRRGRPPLTQTSATAASARNKPTPSEATSWGGLVTGSKSVMRIFHYASGDADSEEVVVPKVPGKNYPSLTVAVKPVLVLNSSLIHQASTERANLDVQVKGVLMYSAGKFTEWLIQQGLIRSEQACVIHNTARKLGMFNDVSKFPFSGGYVWISDCCPTEFMSVYYGSILEGSCYIPNVILKLIYHWACQTNVTNVVQWVKVPAIHVKEVYSLLRAACTLALHEKYGLLGGRGKKVQVAYITLGSASNRNPRVDVLGAMDESSKMRLLAVDNEKKRRPGCIASLLANVIDPRSTICLESSDLTKAALATAGFTDVIMGVDEAKQLLEYMRKAVPRIFQQSVQLLSKNIIQQFLDELVWRERWGGIAAYAFNTMTKHLADFTLHSKEDRILDRLKKTAENPFRFMTTVAPANIPVTVEESAPKRAQKRASGNESPTPAKKLATSAPVVPLEPYWKVQPLDPGVTAEIAEFINSNSDVSLESFFYGFLRGDDNKIIDRKPADQVVVKCSVCLRPFFDNLMLLKHLLLHYQVKPCAPGPLRNAQQCQKCFIAFPNLQGLRAHQAEVHAPSQDMKDRMCFICEKLFADKVQLIYHMHRTHVPQELPYVCQVCGFRTSWYTALLEHFVQNHRGGRHLLCPYCLMTVGLTRNDEAVASNIVFFTSHVQRHQREADFGCHRCRLSFISAHFLERHIENDHCSLRLNENITAFKTVCNTMMPAPGALIKAALLPNLKERTRKPGQYSVREFPTPICPLVPVSATCAECEESMAKPGHFSGVMKCSKCPYQSCCESAAAEHFSLYHEKNAPIVFSSGQAALTMYCACSFFSSSPNTLAKHLVKCQKAVAYSSEAAAQRALGIKTGEEETEHTVLNVLGLMRNPAEPVVKLPEAEERETASEPRILICQPKVVLSKLESIDAMATSSVMDEDSEATVSATSSQDDNPTAIITETQPTLSNQPSPKDAVGAEGGVSKTEHEVQEPMVEGSPQEQDGKPTDSNTSEVMPDSTPVEDENPDLNKKEEQSNVPMEIIEEANKSSEDAANNAEANKEVEEADVPANEPNADQPGEAVVSEEQGADAAPSSESATPPVEEKSEPVQENETRTPTEGSSENSQEPGAKVAEEAKTENKEESAGRWIEELENMMDTDDITPSVVSEAPDFVTDFMNSESA